VPSIVDPHAVHDHGKPGEGDIGAFGATTSMFIAQAFDEDHLLTRVMMTCGTHPARAAAEAG
jgi:hypothetical protein